MLCVHVKNTDPFYCLAAEEYLLKNFSDDIFMLWQSENTVVVGKHQIAMAEINYPYVHRNNIRVARRISGGGTVFHDAGNVNFAYIKNVSSPAEISFTRFTQPVVDALAELGITAITSGRNDLLVKGKKISGNAEHVFKNRVLHHGTLLFNSDLKILGKSLQASSGKYHGKAVQSNRSEVVNILPFLKKKRTTDEFSSFLLDVQLKKPSNRYYELNAHDIRVVQNLMNEKYTTWEWNFGYSPEYTFKNTGTIEGKSQHFELSVKKGRIVGVVLSGSSLSGDELNTLKNRLLGAKHFYDDIRIKLEEVLPKVSDDLIFTFF
jgi:lipoate---protein ligase